MTAPFRPVRPAGEQRRTDINRINAMTAKYTITEGTIEIVGAGEVALDLRFLVVFTVEPHFEAGGAVLVDGSHPTAGNYPTARGVVDTWEIVNRVEGAFDGYYVGGRFLIVVTGAPDQHCRVHWSCRGVAIRNPINNEQTLEDPV